MIHENQENEHLTNTIVTILVSMLLGGLAGALSPDNVIGGTVSRKVMILPSSRIFG